MKINSITKLCILALISEGRMHGYEILKEVEKKTGVKLSASHIYPFLKELKRNGFVDAQRNDKGHEKHVYYMTLKGKKFYQEFLKRFSVMLEAGMKERITRCFHCGCEIYNNHYYHLFRGKKRAFCCTHCAEACRKVH